MSAGFPPHLLMIGCGNMAGAMLARWLACGLDPAAVTVVRPSGRAVAPGVGVRTDLPAAVARDAVLLLGLKPQQLPALAPALAPLAAGRTLVTMLAGLPVARQAALLPGAHVVRVMPNTPVALGKGVSALYAAPATPAAARDAAAALMRPLGLVEWLEDEDRFDLVTALSGCGPAFVYRFVDALASAAAGLGLPPEQAARLALATVEGAAALAGAAGEDPATLADRVASPGGMTRAGLDVLDADRRLETLLAETLRAARDRGAELAKG